jgi:hypothetical protein
MIMRRAPEEDLDWEYSLRALGVDPFAWFVHFGLGLPGRVCCRDCVDFTMGLCQGGGDPVKCMRDVPSEAFY